MTKGFIRTCLATAVGLVPISCGIVSDSERPGTIGAIIDIITSPGPGYNPPTPSQPPELPSNANPNSPYPIRIPYHNNVTNRNNIIDPFHGHKVLEGATIGPRGSLSLDSGLIAEWGHEITQVYISFHGKPCPEDFAVLPYGTLSFLKTTPQNHLPKNWPTIPRIDGPYLPVTNNVNLEDNFFAGTDYLVPFPNPTRFVGIFNYSNSSITVSVIKEDKFNFGATASCNRPDYIYNPPPDDSSTDPISSGDRYVDRATHIDVESAVLGPPDGNFAFIGFGDQLSAYFEDNIPRDDFGKDIIIYTARATQDVDYNVIIGTGTDPNFLDISGTLYAGSRNIEVDLFGLGGDFSKMEVALIVDPFNQSEPIGVDAIESLHNE